MQPQSLFQGSGQEEPRLIEECLKIVVENRVIFYKKKSPHAGNFPGVWIREYSLETEGSPEAVPS